MMRHPLLLLLLLLSAVIAIADGAFSCFPLNSSSVWEPSALTRQAIVTRQPQRVGRVTRLVVRLADRREVMLSVVDTTEATAPSATLPGDKIIFYAQVEPPRNAGNPGEMDYAAYLRHQGISGQAFCGAEQWQNLGAASSPNLRERMLRLRSRMVATYAQHFDGQTLAVVSAMTLGDRTLLDRSVRQLYSRTGASHVLALSGLHLAILVGFLAFLVIRPLRRFGRWGRVGGLVLTLAVVWAFVMLAGLPLSLVRAATMYSCVATFQTIRRKAPPYHSLVLTLFVMLLWSPQQLFDVGLQLSAVAVAAIIWVGRLTEHGSAVDTRLKSWQLRTFSLRRRAADAHPWLAKVVCSSAFRTTMQALGGTFAVSLAAQVATMPLVAHYFHRVSLVGLASSFVVIPAATIVLLLALCFWMLPPLRDVCGAMLSLLLDVVHRLLDILAALPCASLTVELSWWGVAGCYVTMVWLAQSVTSRRTRAIGLRRHVGGRPLRAVIIVTFLTLSGETLIAHFQRPRRPLVAVYNRANRSEVHLVTPASDSILTPASPHLVGRVLLFGSCRVALVDTLFPRLPLDVAPTPLPVDVVLVSRGAKGHLEGILQRYAPQMVVLDGCLSDYYRERFADEASNVGLPLYDVKRQGAFVLDAPLRPASATDN